MLKTRLNSETRSEIVKKAMSLAFDARNDEIGIAWGKAQRASYTQLFSSAERKRMKTLGDMYVGSAREIILISRTPEGEYRHRFKVDFGVEQKVPAIYSFGYKSLEILTTDPICIANQEYDLALQTLKADREQFRKDITVRLNAISNYEQLFRAWPEVRKMMGEDFWKPRIVTLPAINFVGIQEMIAAAAVPPPEEE